MIYYSPSLICPGVFSSSSTHQDLVSHLIISSDVDHLRPFKIHTVHVVHLCTLYKLVEYIPQWTITIRMQNSCVVEIFASTKPKWHILVGIQSWYCLSIIDAQCLWWKGWYKVGSIARITFIYRINILYLYTSSHGLSLTNLEIEQSLSKLEIFQSPTINPKVESRCFFVIMIIKGNHSPWIQSPITIFFCDPTYGRFNGIFADETRAIFAKKDRKICLLMSRVSSYLTDLYGLKYV